MLSENHEMPRWVERLFRLFYTGDRLQEKLGDFEEYYQISTLNKGKFKKSLWCLFNVIRLLLSEFRLSFYWSFAMFKNYVTIASRSLKRHKIYSIVTISGLALGIAAFLLIAVWVLHELSFDRFHENASDIFRVSGHQGRYPKN